MPLHKEYRRLLYLVLFIGLAVAVSLLLQDVFHNLIADLAIYESEHVVLGPIFFILLAAASVMLGPFTSAPLMPFAVAIWGVEKTLAFLLVGWLMGNSAAYAIGRNFGRPIVRLIVEKEKLHRWSKFLSERVDIKVLFLFRLAVPAEVGYVFGILHYDFWKYLAIVLPAELPFALLVVYSGDAFLDKNWYMLILLVATTVGIIAGAFYLLKEAKKHHKTHAKRKK